MLNLQEVGQFAQSKSQRIVKINHSEKEKGEKNLILYYFSNNIMHII